MPRTTLVLIAVLSFVGLATVAQQSASFQLDEGILNLGGSPALGLQLQSTNYRISVSSLGEGLAQPALNSEDEKLLYKQHNPSLRGNKPKRPRKEFGNNHSRAS